MSDFRAPFIWTPRQSIATDLLRQFNPDSVRDEGLNRWFLFRTAIDLTEPPMAADVQITVDGRYLLYVNGSLAGRGPVRCSPLAQRYDSYDLAPHLRAGSNAVAVVGRAVGHERAALAYEARAAGMTRRLDEAHWDEARGAWVDMVDPATGGQNPAFPSTVSPP